MPTYQELCDRRAEVSKELDAITVFPEGTDAPLLTAEQHAETENLETEFETLSKNIKQYEADQILRDRQRARAAALSSTTRLVSTTAAAPVTETVETIGGEPQKLRISFPRTFGRLKGFKGPDAADNAFKSGQFLLAAAGNQHAATWCREHSVKLAAQAEDSNQLGGFLVPNEFETAIIDLREEYGVFRRESKVVPMSSDTKTIPRRKSGLTAYYVGENTEITESNMTWNQVQLIARKLGILAKYSSELDEDSIIDMASTLADEAAYAFSLEEDQAGFLGAGAATHGGISGLITECTAATATVVTAAGSNIDFSTLDLLDFQNMIGKLPQYADAGAKWFISRAGWAASIMRLLEAAGGNTGDMLAGRAPMSWLGYPVVISQVMENRTSGTTGATGALYLGNLTLASTLGNRRGITVMTSEHRFMEDDTLAIRVTERYDIKVHDVGDTTVAGSMVMLTFA